MKKNISLCAAIVIAFVVGFFLGGWVYTSRDLITPKNDLTCVDGSVPDKNGCCDGELYTDMGDLGFNCCPEAGGDCFPPIR